MKEYNYTNEKNILMLIALLKKSNIKKVIVSPGATNVTFVRSIQSDPHFELYSCVDERSAAYMACGLAYEAGEPVVLSCTGATASRNYLPGLTEAFYRKLPVIAITSTQDIEKVGHLVPQVIDRSIMPKDVVKISVNLPFIKDSIDFWNCEININRTLFELKRNGGGPVHINLATRYSCEYDTKNLPDVRLIQRITLFDRYPEMPKGKIAVLVGSHKRMSAEETQVIDDFCMFNNAVVLCDHTSSYKGNYRVLHSISSSQRKKKNLNLRPDLIIHIGEVTGDYSLNSIVGAAVWRVNIDGEIKDTFGKLQYVFEMPEKNFFEHYSKGKNDKKEQYYLEWCEYISLLNSVIPDIPFSNLWIAKKLHSKIEYKATIHFAILNSLRSWNFFELNKKVESISNVGGFGIDGCISTLIGASLSDENKIYYVITGDLAFFYDMNSIGNRHITSNVRILLVNNGIGTEFKNYNHLASRFDEITDPFIAAKGHFGNKSENLVKNYCENLGYTYMCAKSKSDFEEVYSQFICEALTDKPIIFEVFTDSEEESKALELITNIVF